MNNRLKTTFAFLLFWAISFGYSQARSEIVQKAEKYKAMFQSATKDKRVLEFFDNLYRETLQEGKTQLKPETVEAYKYIYENNAVNYYMLYVFNEYMALIENPADRDLQLQAIRYLESECLDVFGKVPVLVKIYVGESLDRNDRKDEAKAYFEKSLKENPESIPLKVYCFTHGNTALKADLLKNHGDHWLVRKFVN